MLHKDAQFREITCDHPGCRRSSGTFNNGDFRDTIDELKDNGWKIFKRFGVFKHYCCSAHAISGE